MTDDTQPTFLCDALILTPGGFVVPEPCRKCKEPIIANRPTKLFLCQNCCSCSSSSFKRSSQPAYEGFCSDCGVGFADPAKREAQSR